MWPHKVIFSVAMKLATYEELSIPLFVQGYLIFMKGEEEVVKLHYIGPSYLFIDTYSMGASAVAGSGANTIVNSLYTSQMLSIQYAT